MTTPTTQHEHTLDTALANGQLTPALLARVLDESFADDSNAACYWLHAHQEVITSMPDIATVLASRWRIFYLAELWFTPAAYDLTRGALPYMEWEATAFKAIPHLLTLEASSFEALLSLTTDAIDQLLARFEHVELAPDDQRTTRVLAGLVLELCRRNAVQADVLNILRRYNHLLMPHIKSLEQLKLLWPYYEAVFADVTDRYADWFQDVTNTLLTLFSRNENREFGYMVREDLGLGRDLALYIGNICLVARRGDPDILEEGSFVYVADLTIPRTVLDTSRGDSALVSVINPIWTPGAPLT